MPKNVSGHWYPDLFDRQLEVFNNYTRALLVCGPRLSGKTIAVLHKIIRHLWETPDARVAMFSKTMKNSKDGGPWSKITKEIIKEWIDAKIGLRFTTTDGSGKPGPKVDGQTRTPFFRIRNMYGGESECMLFSLDYDHDVESKLKEMEFSMIYFSELSKFESPKLLSISLLSLRMKHLRFEQQQWIADTNPSDEGESSWIYRTWYREKNWTYEEYVKNNTEEGLAVQSQEDFYEYQQSLGLIEIMLTENPMLSKAQVREAKMACGTDIGMYARLIEGKWIYGDGDKSRHFRGVFLPAVHVVGNAESENEDDWIYANPRPTSFELISGWDLGDTNHAAGLVDRNYVNNKSCFTVIDELVALGEPVSIETFSEGFMEMVQFLEETFLPKVVGPNGEMIAGRYDLERAWSDRSSIEKYQATGDTYPYLIVHSVSAGRIFLRGVPKAQGSVRVRVQLMRQLLAQKRIQVSAHCKHVIAMLKNLKKGRTPLTYVVPDEHKHTFDWLTYLLLMECAEELSMGSGSNSGSRSSGGLFVQV